MMCRLRDLASPCLDYGNKYEFYGRIAEDTQAYMQENGDLPESRQDLIVHLLGGVISRLESQFPGRGGRR